MSNNIPLIDLSKCGLLVAEDDVTEKDSRQSGDELYAALSTAGFAYLKNHGFEWKMVDDLNEIAETFFSLPLEVKKQFQKQSLELTYDSIGNSKANLKQVDSYEGFRAAGDAYKGNAFRWPDVPGLRESYVRFADVSSKLMMRLLKALGYGLKLKDVNYFCKAHSLINQKGNLSILKTIRYPPIDDDDVGTENRIGEHTDKCALVLLFQDELGGLQVKANSGEFVHVPPIPGTIVINAGDTLEAWSGNRIKATVHRVIPPQDPNNRGKVRRSVGYFGQANSYALMKRLVFQDDVEDEQEDNDGKKPLTVEEHMNKTLGPIFSYKY